MRWSIINGTGSPRSTPTKNIFDILFESLNTERISVTVRYKYFQPRRHQNKSKNFNWGYSYEVTQKICKPSKFHHSRVLVLIGIIYLPHKEDKDTNNKEDQITRKEVNFKRADRYFFILRKNEKRNKKFSSINFKFSHQ